MQKRNWDFLGLRVQRDQKMKGMYEGGGDFVKVHIGIYAIQDIKGCGILRPPPPPLMTAQTSFSPEPLGRQLAD